jgi:hypothetical protein
VYGGPSLASRLVRHRGVGKGYKGASKQRQVAGAGGTRQVAGGRSSRQVASGRLKARSFAGREGWFTPALPVKSANVCSPFRFHFRGLSGLGLWRSSGVNHLSPSGNEQFMSCQPTRLLLLPRTPASLLLTPSFCSVTNRNPLVSIRTSGTVRRVGTQLTTLKG